MRGGGHGGGAGSCGPVGTRSWRWADAAGAAGLRLRLSKRKRNYSKHLRQLALAFPFPLSLPRTALRPARSCALGPSPWPGLRSRSLSCRLQGGWISQIGPLQNVRPYLVCVRPSSLGASFSLAWHPAQILTQSWSSVIAEPNPPVTVSHCLCPATWCACSSPAFLPVQLLGPGFKSTKESEPKCVQAPPTGYVRPFLHLSIAVP